MNTHKKLLVLLLASATMPLVHGRFSFPSFDELDEFFDRQWEEMNKMRKQMRSSAQNSQQALTLKNPVSAVIDDQEKQVIITITGIDAQEINARLNDENTTLTVTTPSDLIRILVNSSLIAAEISHEAKQMTKDDKNKEQEMYSSFVTNTAQTVCGTPLLEQQNIEYDKENKELMITIPKKEKGKSVVINHVTKLKKQNKSKISDSQKQEKPKK